MNNDFWAKAEKLAERPYVTEVMLDETTDGQHIYVARAPELEGCMAQGKTDEEAVLSLSEARIDYIHSLLEDGLPIPHPRYIAAMTVSASDAVFFLTDQFEIIRKEQQDRPEEHEKRAFFHSPAYHYNIPDFPTQ